MPRVSRISSSGRGSPDRFKLDQYPWSVLPERHRTVLNCNPNCNPGRDPGKQAGTLTYALRAGSRALLAGSNLVPASGSQVAGGGDRWLLTAVRGHLGDTPGARRPGPLARSGRATQGSDLFDLGCGPRSWRHRGCDRRPEACFRRPDREAFADGCADAASNAAIGTRRGARHRLGSGRPACPPVLGQCLRA